MPLFSRPDGKPATDIAPYRQMMPFIMKTRTESAVYFEQQIDLTRTLDFIEHFNANHERRINIFHVFLWAAVRTLHERPRLNRFVVGDRVYLRDGIWMTFSAKKALNDDAPIVTLKRKFDPRHSFEELVSFVYGDLDKGRGNEKSHVDKELSFFLKLPGPLLRLGVKLWRLLDAWNLLPGSLIHPDPMYTSMFVANLGSLKIESAFHHLYEHGNCPLFAALGKKKQVVVVDESGQPRTRTVCSIKYTLDERVEDGLYCAGALDTLRGMLEDPVGHGAQDGTTQVLPPDVARAI
jgi:hypothetical protein